jgi:hypothetical protein
MPDVLRINRIEITFAKREVVNGIKQVGFTGAIGSHKTIDLVSESQFSLTVIFKIC